MHKLLITFCCFSLALLGEARRAAFLPKNSNGKGSNKNSQDVPTVINSTRVTNWGDWSEFESCDPNTFVVGFRQKVEPKHDGDNTALNAIELICNDKGFTRILGATGDFGKWGDEQYCKGVHGVKGFQLKQQQPQDDGDNTAANALRLVCQDDFVVSVNNDGEFGEWTEKIQCPENHAICGLRVQIQKSQNSSDNTALNNVDFQCCPVMVSKNIIPTPVESTRNTDRIIRSPRVTSWGDWYDMDNCRRGTHVVGFSQKVEGRQGSGDDTALNGIELICSNNGGRISSGIGSWGSWSNEVFCSGGRRANGFWLQQEPPQGSGDDTAANAFSLLCEDGSDIEANNNGPWGSWSELIRCPANTFICGISVQLEDLPLGMGDDTALNNVDLMCC